MEEQRRHRELRGDSDLRDQSIHRYRIGEGGNGPIRPSSQTINAGSTATFVVTPNSGYHANTVTGDTCTVTNTSGTLWTSGAINQNCVVTATFAINQHAVTTVVIDGNGSISPPTQTMDSGNSATIIVTPNAGYHVNTVTGNACTVTQQGASTTWTTSGITANCAITATFAIDTYTVTASVNGSNSAICRRANRESR